MYARTIDGTEPTFGVSGLLWNANVLMYDRETETLWSQVKREAVAGPRAGTRLATLPSTVTTWKRWRTAHPDTTVLTTDTGHRRDYDEDPYGDYYESRSFFGFLRPDPRGKELVAGLEAGGVFRAYPLETLRQRGRIADRLGGREVEIVLDPATDTVTARVPGGPRLDPVVTYWGVWRAIHRETGRYVGRE